MSHDTAGVCRCMARHRPAPLELNEHHVIPRYLGGADEPANKVWLCPTAHTNTHEILREFLRAGRALSLRECSQLWGPPVSAYAWRLARRGFLGWKAKP